MSIIYNGTDLSALTYNGIELTDVWVCDTSTTCCIKVFPTITYNYCEFDYSVNLSFTCSTSCSANYSALESVDTTLGNGNTNSYNRIRFEATVASGFSPDYHGAIHNGSWYVTNRCCVDASPTCVYCESGSSCIEVYTLSTWQSNSLNVVNNNSYSVDGGGSSFNCNFVYNINTTGNSIEYPAASYTLTGYRETNSSWISWSSDVKVDCPQNSRYVVMACVVDGTSTILTCCPISNSAGSITIGLP